MFIWKLPVLHDAHQFVAQLKHEPNKKNFQSLMIDYKLKKIETVT